MSHGQYHPRPRIPGGKTQARVTAAVDDVKIARCALIVKRVKRNFDQQMLQVVTANHAPLECDHSRFLESEKKGASREDEVFAFEARPKSSLSPWVEQVLKGKRVVIEPRHGLALIFDNPKLSTRSWINEFQPSDHESSSGISSGIIPNSIVSSKVDGEETRDDFASVDERG
ncbi:MAG: hypothetical protein MN733_22210 [Nitrososphaera sp.]|nr:hypothetical protein [Nitrososphaera sp.]